MRPAVPIPRCSLPDCLTPATRTVAGHLACIGHVATVAALLELA